MDGTPTDTVWTVRPGPAICKALVVAQRAAKSVEKGSENTFHHYRYASAEAIMAEGREALNGAGLALVGSGWTYEAWPKEIEELLGAVGHMKVEYLLVHDSGEVACFTSSVAVMPERSKNSSGWLRPLDKAQATALTYSAGYTLRGLLMLPRVSEDEDADATSRESGQSGQAPSQPDGRQRADERRQQTGPGPFQALQLAKTIAPTQQDIANVIERHFGQGVRDVKAIQALSSEQIAAGMAALRKEADDLKAAKTVSQEIKAQLQKLALSAEEKTAVIGTKHANEMTLEELTAVRDKLAAMILAKEEGAAS